MKSLWVVLLAVLFLIPTGVWAQKQSEAPPPAEVKKEQPPEVPNLADLVLQANKLSRRRAALQTKIAHWLDLPALEKGLQKIEANLAKYSPLIKQLQESTSLNFDKIAVKFTYLLGALFFIIIWMAFFGLFPKERKVIVWSSIAWGPAGPISEYWHRADYWRPDLLFAVHIGNWILEWKTISLPLPLEVSVPVFLNL